MRRQFRIVAVALAVSEIAGCARIDYRFHVVDATTGRALPGAHVVISCHGHYFNNRLFPGDEVAPQLVSNPDGDIVAERIIDGPGWQRDLTISCPGYQTVLASNGVAASSESYVFHFVEPNPPGSTLAVAEQKLSPSDVNTIEMRKFNKESKQKEQSKGDAE